MLSEEGIELVDGGGNVFRDFGAPLADLKQAKAVGRFGRQCQGHGQSRPVPLSPGGHVQFRLTSRRPSCATKRAASTSDTTSGAAIPSPLVGGPQPPEVADVWPLNPEGEIMLCVKLED